MEPGVLARQSSNSSCLLPYKKRWYSLLYPRSPIHPERSFSNENKSKTKDSGLGQRSTLNSCDSTDTKESCLMSGTVNPSMLSLSLNKRKDISKEGSCKNGLNSKDADDTAHTDRSNWDLNTPMDSWEGSGDVVPVHDTSQIDLLGKTSSSLDRKPPISSASVIGFDGDGKQVVGASEQEFNFPISSIHPSLRHKSADVLRLSLGSTLRGFDSSTLQSLYKVDSSRVSPNSSLLKNLALDRNMNLPTCKTVKSEPVVEALVQANAGTVVRTAGTFEANVVKTEVVRKNLQSIELSTKGPLELLEQKPMKCELLQEISMTSDVIAPQSVGRVQLQESSSSSSTLPMPLTPQQGCTSRLSTCSDLSVSGGDLSTPSEYSVHTNEPNRSKNALDQANDDIAAQNEDFDLKELNACSVKVEAYVSGSMNIEDRTVYKKTQDTHNLVASGEGLANDGEKISISACTEEECYGSDYESDGHQAFAGHVDTESVGCVREDEEYEDGEVREPMMQSIVEDPIAEGMDSGKNKNDHKDINLGGPLLDKDETTRDDEQRPVRAIHQGSFDQSGIADVQEGCEKDVLCVRPSAGSRGAVRNVCEANNEYIGRSDMSATALSSLQNAETPVNTTCSKDLSNFGSKSRIISLPRASDVTSSSDFRPVMGRSLSSRSGRERDEIYGHGSKFVLDRSPDRSFGISRGDFMRGRGRGSDRFHRSRRDRDSGRDFESYGDVADYRFRHKRTAAVGEYENERNAYDSRLDGAAFGSNRRRKPFNDDLPSFRHPPARRLSPNGREDSAAMGIQMLRRAPRNISPSRCTGEDGSEYVGPWHSEKFDRNFPADISDPVYSHQQSMYDRPDAHFVQGNTRFTAIQRRDFPQTQSKSPVRSRTWSSLRRRLTEGLNGHQDSSQHRSPVMYRERMRSSPRTSFTNEAIAPQRPDSPSYTARRLNDMSDVDAVQERHPRSLSNRRNPPDQVFTSTSGRVEILDHRERADGDAYLDGPIHTGRFPELHSGESTDKRRKYGERQGGHRQIRNAEEQDGGHVDTEGVGVSERMTYTKTTCNGKVAVFKKWKREPGVVARQSSNSLFPYKKRYSLLYPHAPIHPSRNVDDLVKPALATKKLADQEAIGTPKVSVKNEVVSKQGESHSKLELPADSGHVELSTSSASVIDKGKLVVGASEQEFNFPISSIHLPYDTSLQMCFVLVLIVLYKGLTPQYCSQSQNL
ncbi:hypothetical protein RDI58_010044 [Solanum bulbocastanum]|uniref:Uncharacterized protein n=1 Tax=Solanum bulbocastanum TaxID=147425 RepID=A0AAN8YJ27_SOLBU